MARKLNIKHLDVEDYYFEESEIPFSRPRLKETVIELMLVDIEEIEAFVLSGVTGDYSDKISSMYRLGAFLSVPTDIRLERIGHRSIERYGARVLAGGDMYKKEKDFLNFVGSRNHSIIDEYAKTLACLILHLDGIKAIQENVRLVIERNNRIK